MWKTGNLKWNYQCYIFRQFHINWFKKSLLRWLSFKQAKKSFFKVLNKLLQNEEGGYCRGNTRKPLLNKQTYQLLIKSWFIVGWELIIQCHQNAVKRNCQHNKPIEILHTILWKMIIQWNILLQGAIKRKILSAILSFCLLHRQFHTFGLEF